MIALKSSKGQIGMMESIMVIFVIFIIIGLGMYFFFKTSISQTKKVGEESCVLSTGEQLSSILNLPEIKCSTQAHDNDCVDIAKVISYKNEPSIKNLNRGLCKKSITFIQSYPTPKVNDTECTEELMRSAEYPDNCDKWTLFEPGKEDIKGKKNVQILETPVSLYFPSINSYRMGKLRLKLYLK
ncbi:hypothetical protein D6777_01695 [Candidatus Woesearchaeota archaeon]|nr:MAG: hypothetical protein D6777_01695 [Candidatus Woesearchaeota archaeon]